MSRHMEFKAHTSRYPSKHESTAAAGRLSTSLKGIAKKIKMYWTMIRPMKTLDTSL